MEAAGEIAAHMQALTHGGCPALSRSPLCWQANCVAQRLPEESFPSHCTVVSHKPPSKYKKTYIMEMNVSS